MIPFLLAAVGGYLIGDSMKDSQTFADGGKTPEQKAAAIKTAVEIASKAKHGLWFAESNSIAEGNNQMLRSKVKEVKHHADELEKSVKPKTEVEAWVVAKAERSASDLSDITHYLDGRKNN